MLEGHSLKRRLVPPMLEGAFPRDPPHAGTAGAGGGSGGAGDAAKDAEGKSPRGSWPKEQEGQATSACFLELCASSGSRCWPLTCPAKENKTKT